MGQPARARAGFTMGPGSSPGRQTVGGLQSNARDLGIVGPRDSEFLHDALSRRVPLYPDSFGRTSTWLTTSRTSLISPTRRLTLSCSAVLSARPIR